MFSLNRTTFTRINSQGVEKVVTANNFE